MIIVPISIWALALIETRRTSREESERIATQQDERVFESIGDCPGSTFVATLHLAKAARESSSSRTEA